MSQCPTVTILIGLPGSGKTNFLSEGFPSMPREHCFDDFHGNSLDNSPTFTQSKHYQSLKELLREGADCLISDIEYCRAERLLDAERGLQDLSRELGIEIKIARKYFENNPNACRHNVVHRYSREPGRNYLEELKKIDDLSSVYDCPIEGSIPVWTWN